MKGKRKVKGIVCWVSHGSHVRSSLDLDLSINLEWSHEETIFAVYTHVESGRNYIYSTHSRGIREKLYLQYMYTHVESGRNYICSMHSRGVRKKLYLQFTLTWRQEETIFAVYTHVASGRNYIYSISVAPRQCWG
jgi:hypothetical protein